MPLDPSFLARHNRPGPGRPKPYRPLWHALLTAALGTLLLGGLTVMAAQGVKGSRGLLMTLGALSAITIALKSYEHRSEIPAEDFNPFHHRGMRLDGGEEGDSLKFTVKLFLIAATALGGLAIMM